MRKNIRILATIAISWFVISYPHAAAVGCPDNRDMPETECLSPGGCSQAQAGHGAQTTQPSPPSSPQASASHPLPMTVQEKFHHYLRSTYGPMSLGFSLVQSGIDQARDVVPEWGQGMEGYGRRFASGFGQKAVRRTVGYGLGAILREDPRYLPSGQSGILSRGLYAAGQVFIAHRDSGGTRFGYSNLIANFAGSCISRQWYPDSYRDWSNYMSSFAISLGIHAGRNLFSEFWPDVRRLLHR